MGQKIAEPPKLQDLSSLLHFRQN